MDKTLFTKQLLDSLNPRQVAQLQQILSHYMKQVQEARQQGYSPEEVLAQLYEIMDDEFQNHIPEETKKMISCKQGCSFCCHIPVEVTGWEIRLIQQFCRDNNIQIDYEKKGRACTFLDAGGNCTIYAVRPVVCRKYFITGDPKFCDTQTFPRHRVLNYINWHMEVLASIIGTVNLESGEMKTMLLKHKPKTE